MLIKIRHRTQPLLRQLTRTRFQKWHVQGLWTAILKNNLKLELELLQYQVVTVRHILCPAKRFASCVRLLLLRVLQVSQFGAERSIRISVYLPNSHLLISFAGRLTWRNLRLSIVHRPRLRSMLHFFPHGMKRSSASTTRLHPCKSRDARGSLS